MRRSYLICMKKKITVGILFGGKSAEHEVSLRSAKNVADALDRSKFDVVMIGIDKTGRWLLNDSSHYLLNSENPKLIKLNKSGSAHVALVPESSGSLALFDGGATKRKVDVVFPILHGTFGEDGTVQGLLKLANIPFVGAGVLGSAVGMDKDVMKRLLRDAGIPIPKFLVVRAGESVSFAKVKKKLGLPVFVKPANLGSSVGIIKVKKQSEFAPAVAHAFRFDRKVLIEEAIVGREIECAVLGNEQPVASIPGEIIVHDEFYSYEAKYISETGATVAVPAQLDKKTVKRVQELAVRTFQVLECEGLGRVDCFLKKNGQVIVNEINTIPGFTSISMYPKAWEASGVSYTELITRLLELAIDRFAKEQKLLTNYV